MSNQFDRDLTRVEERGGSAFLPILRKIPRRERSKINTVIAEFDTYVSARTPMSPIMATTVYNRFQSIYMFRSPINGILRRAGKSTMIPSAKVATSIAKIVVEQYEDHPFSRIKTPIRDARRLKVAAWWRALFRVFVATAEWYRIIQMRVGTNLMADQVMHLQKRPVFSRVSEENLVDWVERIPEKNVPNNVGEWWATNFLTLEPLKRGIRLRCGHWVSREGFKTLVRFQSVNPETGRYDGLKCPMCKKPIKESNFI